MQKEKTFMDKTLSKEIIERSMLGNTFSKDKN